MYIVVFNDNMIVRLVLLRRVVGGKVLGLGELVRVVPISLNGPGQPVLRIVHLRMAMDLLHCWCLEPARAILLSQVISQNHVMDAFLSDGEQDLVTTAKSFAYPFGLRHAHLHLLHCDTHHATALYHLVATWKVTLVQCTSPHREPPGETDAATPGILAYEACLSRRGPITTFVL